MFRIKLKYFPYDISQYALFFLASTIYMLVFFISIEFIIHNHKKNTNNNTVLIIPKTLENYQEKKDLIFNYLSLYKEINAVTKIENKEVLKVIEKKLRLEKIEEMLIPELFRVEIGKGKTIQINKINDKISKIIYDARLIQKQKKSYFLTKNFYFLIFLLILLYLISQHLIIMNTIKTDKNLLFICNSFGVNPNSLTTNLFIGYLLLFSISLLLFNFFILLFVQKIYVLYMINSIYFYSFCFAVINFMLIFLNIMISLKRLNKSR